MLLGMRNFGLKFKALSDNRFMWEQASKDDGAKVQDRILAEFMLADTDGSGDLSRQEYEKWVPECERVSHLWACTNLAPASVFRQIRNRFLANLADFASLPR